MVLPIVSFGVFASFVVSILLFQSCRVLAEGGVYSDKPSHGGGNVPPPPPPSSNYYSYLRCWRCDYDDADQCVKNFDFTKHKHEACDGKCLKAFEKIEARTKIEIDKAQLTPTIRKCVSQKEISSLQTLGINTKNGCHDIRTAKRRHKLYCFCENDLCNGASLIKSSIPLAITLLSIFVLLLLNF